MRYANLSPAQCRAEVKKRGLPLERDRRPTPGVGTALRFAGPLEGVKFLAGNWKTPYGVMDCRLALSFQTMAEVLSKHGVTEVHIGTMYRPEKRRKKHSQHGYGLAADIIGFKLSDGRKLVFETDWHGEIGEPSCGPDSKVDPPSEKGILLRNLVCDLARQGLFHFMLTPNYNRAHHDHLHVDLKRDAKRGVIR